MTRLPETIERIEDIQSLAQRGFDDWLQYGHVNVTARGDLRLFDYTTAAHMAQRWNFFERVSRGLIINRDTGEIVARPFDKFFYWLEGGRASRGHIVTVMEKMDGSLGILYRHKDEFMVTTKGSFFSKQSRWATDFLGANFDLAGLPDKWTLLFEIVYPDNRIIVDYGGREDLTLLAARNRFTGEYMPFFPDLYELAQQYGFTLPQVFGFNSVTDLLEATGKLVDDFEGYVVAFSDGQRFKFKLDRYIELHKLIRGLTFRNILKSVEMGDIDTVFDSLPEAYTAEARDWVREIGATRDTITKRALNAFEQAPHDSLELFESWVEDNHPTLKPYLLALYVGRDLTPVIYHHAFQERLMQRN
jgi:RNA ligase